MADIAPQPFINYGASQAQQGQQTAAAGLENQQAQGAAMQNQITKAQMPFIMKMYQQMGAQSTTSGVAGQGQPGGPLAAKQDALAANGFDPDKIHDTNATQYLVPEWTDAEQQNQKQAAFLAGMGQPAAAQYYAMQRQQRLDNQRQISAFDSSNRYSLYAAAQSAPSPYEYLKNSGPEGQQYTNWLDKFADQQAQQGNPVDKDFMAHGYAQYQTADLHQYTGRPVEYQNNVAVDKVTGLPVAGVPQLPMSAKDQAQFMKDAQTPSIEVQTGRPGQTKKVSPWEAAGYPNVHTYLAATEQQAAPTPAQLAAFSAGKVLSASDLADLQHQHATQALQNAGQGQAPAPFKPTDHAAPDPQNPGALVPMPPHPPGASTAPGIPAPQAPPAQPKSKTRNVSVAPYAGAAPPPGGAQPAGGAPPQPGAAPPQKFQGTETLPGVNPNTLPKYTPPTNGPNTSATTEQNLDIAAQNKEKYNQLGLANQQLQKNGTERGLLDQAQVEINNLRANPRAVGPGSPITTAWNEFKTYATGQTPDVLTERKMFDKVLLQMGAVNVKQAFDNQSRIGQQEYMKLLTEGNPTSAMPLDAIQKLVNFARYNNEFTTRSSNTKVAALRSGADPYSQQFNNLDQGRAAYVQARMNPGQSTTPTPAAPTAPTGAPQEGATHTSKSGRPMIFKGGSWQYSG